MSPWFSFWGLVADMVGVAIITYDVWPEYRLHRLRESVEWQYKVLFSSLNVSSPKSDVGQVAQSMLNSMGLNQMNRLRGKLKLPPISEDRKLPTRNEIMRSQDETNLAILQRVEALSRRARPPMTLGVFLVILGFLLQAIGALPSAFTQAYGL